MAFAAIVLAALFYLKMTYFAVGMAMLAVALVASSGRARETGAAGCSSS